MYAPYSASASVPEGGDMTTPSLALLTEEQQALLAQFEFRAILETSETAVVVVGSAMRNAADSSSTSSVHSAASSSATSSLSAAPASATPCHRAAADGDGELPCTATPVPSMHIVATSPLLHAATSPHSGGASSCADGSKAATALAAEAVPLDSHALGDETTVPPSIDQLCSELAERLLRSSAEVGAMSSAMDRHVLPPSEFC
ncbi:hypothetical protein NESM_000265500 [Novymonas esmeraldas]|uniref:Uncharacterized protein n=1 Tax=Novymonas esmeraldas TaxID=1808958 RepID=A0AAW0F6V1_9TRYP